MVDFATLLATSPWLIYAAVLAAPFVQEDAAVLGAAALSANGQGEAPLLFAAVLAGLTASDVWKYWAGAWLPRMPMVRKLLGSPRIEALGRKVSERLAGTLIAARLIPGARIPTYVACGLFRVDFRRFLIVLVLAGALYVALAFVLFGILGDLGGAFFTRGLPVSVLSLIAILILATMIRQRLHRVEIKSQPT